MFRDSKWSNNGLILYLFCELILQFKKYLLSHCSPRHWGELDMKIYDPCLYGACGLVETHPQVGHFQLLVQLQGLANSGPQAKPSPQPGFEIRFYCNTAMPISLHIAMGYFCAMRTDFRQNLYGPQSLKYLLTWFFI